MLAYHSSVGWDQITVEAVRGAAVFRLVECAYRAIDDEKDGWNTFTATLGEALGDCRIVLVDFQSFGDVRILSACSDDARRLFERVMALPDLIAFVRDRFRTKPAGAKMCVPDTMISSELAATDGSSAKLDVWLIDAGDASSAALFVLYPDLSATRLASNEKIIRALVSHLGRAKQIADRLDAERSLASDALAVIDRFDQAAALLDARGRVVYLNPAMQRIIDARDGLEIAQEGLRPTACKARQLFEKLAREAIADRQISDPPSGVTLPRPSGGRPLQMAINAICASAATRSHPQDRRLLVLITDPDAEASISPAALQQLFGVTGREAEVITELVAGRNIDETAVKLGISRDTATIHVKHALAKTGARRQAELVALALRSPAHQRRNR